MSLPCAPPFPPLPPNAAANIAVQTGIPHGATRMPHWQRRCPRASPRDRLDPKDRSRVAYLPCRLDLRWQVFSPLAVSAMLVVWGAYIYIYIYIIYIYYLDIYTCVLVCSISGSISGSSWNSATTIASSGLMASRSDRARSTSHHEVHMDFKKIKQIKVDSKLLQDASSQDRCTMLFHVLPLFPFNFPLWHLCTNANRSTITRSLWASPVFHLTAWDIL